MGVRMPRTPAVYEPKRRWRLREQADADVLLPASRDAPVELGNYRSAELEADAVERVLEARAKCGRALKITHAEAT